LYTVRPGNPYRRGRISTLELLVQASLDHLLFILKLYIFTKQPILMRRSTVLSLPLKKRVLTCSKWAASLNLYVAGVERERERERDRQTDRQTDREGKRERDRETDRERENE
jgi:hypothetical protein